MLKINKIIAIATNCIAIAKLFSHKNFWLQWYIQTIYCPDASFYHRQLDYCGHKAHVTSAMFTSQSMDPYKECMEHAALMALPPCYYVFTKLVYYIIPCMT